MGTMIQYNDIEPSHVHRYVATYRIGPLYVHRVLKDWSSDPLWVAPLYIQVHHVPIG